MFKILVISFLFVNLAVLLIHGIMNRRREHLLDRLKSIAGRSARQQREEEDELSKPFAERVFKPLVTRASRLTLRFTPGRSRKKIEQALILAGRPGNLKPHEFQFIHFSLIAIAALAAWIVTSRFMVGFLSGIGAYLGGWIYLNMLASARKKNLLKDLPDILDLLTVSVEAGLGFDAALLRVIEKSKGVLAEELGKVLQEVQMGKARREALRDMAERLGVEDIQLFSSAMNQADLLGISIGNVLRSQSRQARTRRRQRVEEQAMKAPIKMLFPLIFCIFPSIFIVILGPAFIQISKFLLGR